MNKVEQTNWAKKILESEYENKIISNGDNFPKINLSEHNLDQVCVLLHNRVKVDEISKYFGWSPKELSRRIELLLQEELIIKKHNQYSPNLMVISLAEGKSLCKQLDEIAYKVAELIENNIDTIKQETFKFESLEQFSFNELSLFILSNVILDSIQIDNVETIFLKSKRTSHNGRNYYCSLQEKCKDTQKEAFGIYGNMFTFYGNIVFGLYGNERDSVNFLTLDKLLTETYFSSSEVNDVGDFKRYLLGELLKYFYEKNYSIDENIVNGFNRLGIMNGNKINIPIFSEDEFDRLSNIANIVRNDYIDIFEEYRKNIFYDYDNSIYSQEISFEEYFIWWYHLLYSKVTDLLIDKGMIVVPNTQNFNYMISLM